MKEVARVVALYRYPVKSMGGEGLSSATVGWHGVAGDRRLAFLRRGASGGFPWLTASKLPALINWQPRRQEGAADEALPSLVRKPDGVSMELRGEELRREISAMHGTEVELVQIDNGIFDDAPMSVISRATSAAIAADAGTADDVRRFRPNVVVETTGGAAFEEDQWLGRPLQIGEEGPQLMAALHDVRCMMINLDPDTAALDPRMLKSAVRLNENRAGVYATIMRTGRINVGDAVYLLD
jgi:uncharacterized protein YcbX